ncbi:uncharacterized protein LOC127281962 isoform X2 [Leptopilina boulardi]|uniref:uncharacterized protein LOC127281962 isoform X2 n=1 Tax=Leptopilina boulardi TaxID=63433 RepID=UPI0021F5B2FE|nr:uncharacterized protein LOC127281962 isoform X2 [Leptopilina boulardi]
MKYSLNMSRSSKIIFLIVSLLVLIEISFSLPTKSNKNDKNYFFQLEHISEKILNKLSHDDLYKIAFHWMKLQELISNKSHKKLKREALAWLRRKKILNQVSKMSLDMLKSSVINLENKSKNNEDSEESDLIIKLSTDYSSSNNGLISSEH